MLVSLHCRLRRAVAGLALAVALFPAARAAAQAPRGSDLLEQYRNRNAVAAQELENDVHDAVVDAQRLATTDPDKALARLQKALARVEADTVLSADRRDALTRDLKERVRVAQADSRRAAAAQTERATRAAVAADRRAAADADASETERVRQKLRNIRTMQAEGRDAEAARAAEDVARRYPTNLAAQVAARTTGMGERVNAARDLRLEGERRRLLVWQDVDRSATMPVGDIEFPKDWAEKTKMRKAHMNPMTPKEKAILESLSKPITLEARDAKFYDVRDELEKLLGQPIVLDEAALKQAMIDENTPVSVHARRPVAARTVLRSVLDEVGLTYVIKDQTIFVTTKEIARQMMVTRTYYIGDLLGQMDLTLPPALNQLQMGQYVAYLIDLIQHTVDTDSWLANDRGGQGTIAFNPATMSLVVKQSAEVHFMLGGSLGR
jgi:hypothetical protein